MFIAVRGKAERMREINSYLYDGQSVVSGPVESIYGAFVVVNTGTDDRYRSEYLRDRIASGSFGVKLFDHMEQALDYIDEESR